MDVDARLEAGHSTEKNVILVLGPLLPALVGSINSFPDFFCSFAGETGVALRVDTESDENWNPTGSSSGLHRFTLHSDNPQLPASLQNGQDRFELY